MTEVKISIKPGPDFSFIELPMPDAEGKMIDALHVHGFQASYSNIPNACSNSLLKVESRGGPYPTPTYYVAIDPTPGFRYLIPISDTINMPEFTPNKIENFLKFVNWTPGVASGHSYGWDLLTDYLAWTGRTFDFQALIDVAGYNDNIKDGDPLINLKQIPKLNASTLFWHTDGDPSVSYKYTDGYIKSFTNAGNSTLRKVEAGKNHDFGKVVMNGTRKQETLSWINANIKPSTPLPVRVGMRELYKDVDKAYVLWMDGSVSEIVTR